MNPSTTVLMGVAGCGKSTVGALLARQQSASFLDGDDFHPADNVERMAAGIALTDVHRADWLEAIAARYAGGHVYRMDGVSVEYPDWHFNVRPSNTEPLLRLNLEATTPATMAARRDEVVGLITA